MDLTNPVELDGATVNFDHIIRRINTTDVKSSFINGLDSQGNTVFSVVLYDREDNGLTNINPAYTEPSESDERQRQTVGFNHPVDGLSLFDTSDIAIGSIPDSNDRSGGSNSFQFFFGREDSDVSINEESAGVFSVSLSSTGWTLDATPFATSVLGGFTTTEQPFFNSNPVDLARIEVVGQTVQTGGYWDNLSVTGTEIIPPEPMTLQVFSNGDIKLAGSDPMTGASGVAIDYIEINSADVENDGGSLNPTLFTGLRGSLSFPAGDGTGNGWEFADNLTDKKIIESYPFGDSTIGNTDVIDLGQGFIPGSTEDISFLYHIAGAPEVTVGLVEYLQSPPNIPGDFDGDGFVGLSDLNILGSNFGVMGGATPATGDTNGDGNVDLADLNVLGSNWNPPPAVAVPEPTAFVAQLLAFVGLMLHRRV